MSWNCSGAESHQFYTHLMEMIRSYKPEVLALLEARVSSNHAKKIVENSYFTNFLAAEACGFARGICFLWDKNSVEIEEISMHDQIIDVLIKVDVRGS